MLARNIKYILCFAALEHLIERVELFRLRQLRDVSGVDQKRRRSRHRVDAVQRDPERFSDIFVRVFAEADVAVTDLKKTQIGGRRQRAGFCNLG